MATKDYCLSLNDKQASFADDSSTNIQYNSLNLNHNNERLSKVNESSKIFTNGSRKEDNYDFTTDSPKNKEDYFRDKFMKGLPSNFLEQVYPGQKENCRKEFGHKEKHSNKSNSSTLSLHITAYEKSVEGICDSNENVVIKKDKKQKEIIKNWKSTKQLLKDSSSNITNSYEFPRQQKENRSSVPGIMQFVASQRLLNPNQQQPGASNNNANRAVSQQTSSTNTPVVILDAEEEPACNPSTKSAKDYEGKELSLLLDKKSDIVCLKEKLHGINKTPCHEVCIKIDGKVKPTNYIRCKKCGVLLKIDGGQAKRHFDECLPSTNKVAKRQERGSLGGFLSAGLSTAEAKMLNQIMGQYTLDNGMSFKRSESTATYQMAASLINLGAQRQRAVTADDMNFTRKSVKISAMKIAETRISELKPFIREAANNGDLCLAIDYGKRFEDYLAVIAHFVVEDDNKWLLMSRPIGFLRCDDPTKNFEVVISRIKEVAAKMGINPYALCENAAISDEGSNILKAISTTFKIKLRCICHGYSTIMNHLFTLYQTTKLSGALKKQIEEAKMILDACKKIASYGRSSKHLELPKKPREPVKTRFMSNLWVLEDVRANLQKLYEVSGADNDINDDVISAINYVLSKKAELDILFNVLKPMEQIVTMFETDSKPTFHLVVLKLKETLHESEILIQKRDTFSKALGSALKEVVERKQKSFVTDYHLAAVMLFPPTRKMAKFTPEERARATNVLIEMNFDFESRNNGENFIAVEDSQVHPSVNPLYDESPTDGIDSFESELQRYQSSTETMDGDDLMDFWFKRQKSYPRLSKIAKKLLSLPAAAVAAERSFSRVKLLITDHRSLLSGETVEGLMLGGCY